jgi:hypothetical protein
MFPAGTAACSDAKEDTGGVPIKLAAIKIVIIGRCSTGLIYHITAMVNSCPVIDEKKPKKSHTPLVSNP